MRPLEDYFGNLDQIKMKALSLALTPSDPATSEELSNLAAVCKTASEAQKVELERSQLEKVARSEATRFWIPIIASLTSVGILAATLILQVSQFKESAKQQTGALAQQSRTLLAQIDANEDTQWREAIRIMADKPALVNGAAGVALLKYFADSKRHGQEARDLGSALLTNMIQADAFDTLFKALIRLDNQDDVNRVLRINRGLGKLNGRVSTDLNKFEEVKKKGERMVFLADAVERPQSVAVDFAIDHQQEMKNEIIDEETITTNALATMLRGAAVARNIDMSDCFLVGSDLSKVNFSGAIITGTGFWKVNVNNTDFSDVRVDTLGQWDETAWWHAARMAPGLVEKLQQSYPFPSGSRSHLGSSRAEFERDLKRLTGQ